MVTRAVTVVYSGFTDEEWATVQAKVDAVSAEKQSTVSTDGQARSVTVDESDTVKWV